ALSLGALVLGPGDPASTAGALEWQQWSDRVERWSDRLAPCHTCVAPLEWLRPTTPVLMCSAEGLAWYRRNQVSRHWRSSVAVLHLLTASRELEDQGTSAAPSPPVVEPG